MSLLNSTLIDNFINKGQLPSIEVTVQNKTLLKVGITLVIVSLIIVLTTSILKRI